MRLLPRSTLFPYTTLFRSELAECTMCHTVTAKYALGVNTAQMNKDHDYGGVVANQLSTLEHLGVFDRKLPGGSRSEEHTSELQSQFHIVCRLLLEKKKVPE